MKALIIGATGATGSDLLELLLKDSAFGEVEIFVRKASGANHPKLKTHIINFDNEAEWKDLVKGDVLFSCLGTTLKAAGSKEEQWKVDYDYQYQFAKVASDNAVPTYILVSAAGAKSDSFLFYSKMKGKLENAVIHLPFQSITIFKPPLLIREDSERKGEVIAGKVLQFLNKLGILKSQKPLATEELAKEMMKSAKAKREGIHFFEPGRREGGMI